MGIYFKNYDIFILLAIDGKFYKAILGIFRKDCARSLQRSMLVPWREPQHYSTLIKGIQSRLEKYDVKSFFERKTCLKLPEVEWYYDNDWPYQSPDAKPFQNVALKVKLRGNSVYV